VVQLGAATIEDSLRPAEAGGFLCTLRLLSECALFGYAGHAHGPQQRHESRRKGARPAPKRRSVRRKNI
jgi:hypothetical protein